MAMEMEVIGDLGFPRWSPIRRRFDPDSQFFAAGNIERELLAKQATLDLTEEEKQQLRILEEQESSKLYSCPLAGCRFLLKSVDEFDDHYSSRPSASCSVCSRVYPTSRLLSIHMSESHDFFFKAKVARGFAMYECLVEDCGLMLKSYKSRKQHLVDKHKFPTSFEFCKKIHPSKKQRQKNTRRKALRNIEDPESRDMQIEEDTMDELVSFVSKLTTSDSPSSISYKLWALPYSFIGFCSSRYSEGQETRCIDEELKATCSILRKIEIAMSNSCIVYNRFSKCKHAGMF